MRSASRYLALLASCLLLALPSAHADDAWVPEGWKLVQPKGWDVPEPDGKALAAEQVMRFNNGAEPETLDPAVMTGVPEHTLAMAMFEGLTIPHPKTLEPMPGMARAWAISPDGLTYRFLIRKEAKWTNGDPVTAADFLASWKRVLTPKTGSQYAYQLDAVKGAKAFRKQTEAAPVSFDTVGLKTIGTHVFEVQLAAPTPYFLQLTYFDTLFPVHVKTVEKHGIKWTRPENIVSNGAFKLAEWKPRAKIVFVKNDGYWNAKRVKLKKVIALPIEDQNTAMTKYLNEEVDWIRSVPAARIDEAKKNPDYFVQPYLGTYYYSFNVTAKPFDDPRVRKAFSLSINRVSICRDVLKSGEIPAKGFCPPGLHGYTQVNKDAKVFDPIQARKLLAEAGYKDGKGFPSVELLYNTNESHKLVAEAIVAMWKQTLGVNVKLRNAEWKVYLEMVEKLQYQVARRGWIGDYGDPNTFLDMWVKGGGNNNTGWADAQYDKLIEKAASLGGDPVARMKVFQEAEKLLVDKLPITPIYHYVNKGFRSPTLGGWYKNVRDLHPFQFMYMTD